MKRIIRISVLSYVLTANKFGSSIINKYGNLNIQNQRHKCIQQFQIITYEQNLNRGANLHIEEKIKRLVLPRRCKFNQTREKNSD